MQSSRTTKASPAVKPRSSSATRLSDKPSTSTAVPESTSSPNAVPAKESPETPSGEANDTSGKPTTQQDETNSKQEETESPASKTPAETVPENEGASTNAASVLQQRPFIIRTLKHDGSDGGGISTGSILSQSLDKLASAGHADVGTMTLAGLRKLVPGMSRFPTLEKFVTPSGTMIDDEAISFAEYLALEEDSQASSASAGGAPSVRLYFQSTKRGELAGKGANGEDASAIEHLDLSQGPSIKARELANVEHLEKSGPRDSLITIDPNTSSDSQLKSAGTLHEDDWDVVLRNCGVFYGWLIDPVTKRIVRAPKPAFRLRSKVDQTSVANIPDWQPVESRTKAEKAIQDPDSLFDSQGKERKAIGSADSITQVAQKAAAEAAASLSEKAAKETPEKAAKETIDKETKEPIEPVVPKSEKGIPNFRVNDDSKIEITAHEDELTVSMAKSDFSESSTEVSVSGGGYGVTASASYAQASSKENTSKTMTNTTTRIMVARYMFPRCDLHLWPDELVPTEELAKLIETIRTTKNIKVLRKLQAEYGQLFCQKTTLGGRLLATKLFSSTEKKTLEEAKESFKTSVGASVSGSYAGVSASASAKHEEAKGSTTSNSTEERSQNESAVFEAVGGDTILANNPPEWCKSVGSHHNWRVINRETLSPLVEILSAMPGYEAVQSWFVQAIPALSNFMVLDASHQCQARFRVTSPTNSLSIPNAGNNASFYLGHDPTRPVTPRLNGVEAPPIDLFWMRIDAVDDIPIFNPPTYRAPALLGYDKFDVEGTPYGSEFNAGFVKTMWTIIAPFDNELAHGTRVILRTVPYRDANQPESSLNASQMVVFRNAQGEFLPAMSDAGEYQYWRLLKTDPTQRYIKPGDEVRLAWDFRDQTTGWRDFTQDVFGRRQPTAPPEYTPSNPLFLKVPWPRFETSGNPTALIMSPQQGDLVPKQININKKEQSLTKEYCLQDLKFRIDNVGNDGRGDAGEYLLSKVKMGEVVQRGIGICRPPPPPMSMRQDIFWFGVIR